MDDKLVRVRVHTAVQQHCRAAGVQPNPYLAQRVLAAARDEGVPVVKKKLSLGLILILILLLASLSALAVSLLTGQEVVGIYLECLLLERCQFQQVAIMYATELGLSMIYDVLSLS